MPGSRGLPPWGAQARWWFRDVLTPAMAVLSLLQLARLVGVDVHGALDGAGLLGVARLVTYVVVTAWLLAGATWLAAEARAGYAGRGDGGGAGAS